MAVITVFSNEDFGDTEEANKLPALSDLGTSSGYYLVLDLINQGNLTGYQGVELCHFAHYTTLGLPSDAPTEFQDSYDSYRIEPPQLILNSRYVFRSKVNLSKGPSLYTWLQVPNMGADVRGTLRVVTV